MKPPSSATNVSKVIITGGRETGGLQSFATTLATGFTELGIPAEVIHPRQIYNRWRDLRDRNILKILSTTAVYAVPFSRRAICMAHGFPRADAQGWPTVLALFASYKMASVCSGSSLVAISHYAASHLKAVYNIQVDAVIHNPLNPLFFSSPEKTGPRCYLTYVGRLHPVKNLDAILPAMQSLLHNNPELRVCVVGDGVLRKSLEHRFADDPRIEFAGDVNASGVRDILRKTEVFVSGCETEALGLTYLEALSQGCSVVMPACGGGLEIAPELIGSKVQLMPLSFDQQEIRNAIRRALDCCNADAQLDAYRTRAIAAQYLRIAATIS